MNPTALDFLHTAAVLAAARLEQYFRERRKELPYAKLTLFLQRNHEISAEALRNFLDETDMETASVSKRRYYSLLNRISEGNRTYAETILGLTLMLALYPETKSALRESNTAVTIALAYAICGGTYCPSELAVSLYRELQPIFLPIPKEQEWYADVRLSADRRLLAYLSGIDDELLSDCENGCRLIPWNAPREPLYLYETSCRQLSPFLTENGRILHIRGAKKSGKTFLVENMAARCAKNLLLLDAESVLAIDSGRLSYVIMQICREALFYDAAVCWSNLTEKTLCKRLTGASEFARRCIQPFSAYQISVCCCSEKALDFANALQNIYVYEMPELTQSMRISLWKQFCSDFACTDVDAVQMAIRHKLEIGQIAAVFRQLPQEMKRTGLPARQCLEQLCGKSAVSSGKWFHVLHSEYRLSDLILPESDKQRIREICANFEYSHKVYHEWGMLQKMPYGRCISVLLSGPPGTGKTMTAHVIANMLELPLFHADLSQISNKYIGETEKNLDAIFTEAEKSNCILLLDEADSICGKRSEVRDARDRYANNDTAFLLQRLEQYDGIVILSTNFVNNLDEAFMRRMKYVLQYAMPDSTVRLRIWESAFSERLPRSSDLDLPYLAEQFAFTGANIKNIVLESAFLAAMKHTEIRMEYILKSIANEYLKFQKRILPGEFGKYSEMYQRICQG